MSFARTYTFTTICGTCGTVIAQGHISWDKDTPFTLPNLPCPCEIKEEVKP